MSEKVVVRKFLNKRGFESIANVYGVCGTGRGWDNSATLAITDCYKRIDLTLPFHTDKECDNSLEKLAKLEDACRRMQTAIREARKVCVAQQAAKEAAASDEA